MNQNFLIANSDFLEDRNFLSHHGIQDQRWGQRNGPPYPLNKEGRSKFRKQRKLEKKAEKLKKEEEAKKAAQEKKQAKLDAEKERILKSGTAREAMQYKGMWTNSELRTITDRIDLEVKLSTMASKEVKTRMDKIEDVAKMVGRWTDVTEKGIGAYNAMAKIYNATQQNKEGGKRLPVVSGGKNPGSEFSKITKTLYDETMKRK